MARRLRGDRLLGVEADLRDRDVAELPAGYAAAGAGLLPEGAGLSPPELFSVVLELEDEDVSEEPVEADFDSVDAFSEDDELSVLPSEEDLFDDEL